MTKRREPLTYERTLATVALRIGWDTCAGICGVGRRAISNWSEPDTQAGIRMIDAERLDRAFIDAGGDHAPFQQLLTLRLELAEQSVAKADLMKVAAEAAKETGEAVSAIIDAAASNDPAKRRRAREEGEEAIASLTKGIAALDAQEREG
ncbi:hypothetical protein [Novosphingobium sp. ES2-1]|jgi:hypothetical protein|uniref:hypothetical protein n=1 Tax=Novosphingobium sp. ES2-1 TaxID=2780074 RepID=UPI00187E38C8|nr:hypothetical protein [Novosphingobium sp. ES2-1]QOV92624.1 hypothetical protein IM701_07890 [Novosphingobium sp. ES2-1]